MKILVIYAHPNPKSLNAAIKEAFVSSLDPIHEVKVLDLYAMKFNPVYEEEYLNRTVGPDVLAIQEDMKWADEYVFISPTWWYNVPAILKGFFDRVFTRKFAFDYAKFLGFTYPVRLLKGKKAIFITTLNSPWWWYYIGMGHWMIRSLHRGTLGFCGLKVKYHLIVGVLFMSPEQRTKAIEKVKKLAESL